MGKAQPKQGVSSRLIRSVLFALLFMVPGFGAARAQSVILKPDQIPEGARSFRLEIHRADGRTFTAPGGTSLSIGIAHGVKLVMLGTTPDRANRPRVLNARIDDLKRVWDVAPRAGDNLLVAVYVGGKPISAPVKLRVTSASIPVKTGRHKSG